MRRDFSTDYGLKKCVSISEESTISKEMARFTINFLRHAHEYCPLCLKQNENMQVRETTNYLYPLSSSWTPNGIRFLWVSWSSINNDVWFILLHTIIKCPDFYAKKQLVHLFSLQRTERRYTGHWIKILKERIFIDCCLIPLTRVSGTDLTSFTAGQWPRTLSARAERQLFTARAVSLARPAQHGRVVTEWDEGRLALP